MKRKKNRRQSGIRYGDVLKNFTPAQLAGIGAVAMTYNEAEAALHDLVTPCIDFPGDSYEVISRINGTEGLTAIIRSATTRFDLTEEQTRSLKFALDEFSQLKTYRDGVIHSRIKDISSGIAVAHLSKGIRVDILLSEESLEALYTRLAILTDEMQELATVLTLKRSLMFCPSKGDEHKLRLEQAIQAATARCQQHQTHRLSLPPFPEFPEEPAVLELQVHRKEQPRSSQG